MRRSGAAQAGERNEQASSVRSVSGVLTGIPALALAAAMVALLASCGGGDTSGSAKQRPASRSPTYGKPRVYAVGGAERSRATVRRPPASALTHSFPLGTETICCRTPGPRVR